MKKIISIILSVALVLTVVTLSVNAKEVSNINSVYGTGLTLLQLKTKFPQGKYWNHPLNGTNNPDTYTSNPCPSNHDDVDTCMHFAGASQCCGFVKKIAYDVYGSYPGNGGSWGTGSLNNVKAGDVIHYSSISSYGHWVMVINRSGNVLTLGECNYDCQCGISWTRTMTISEVSAKYPTVYVAPNELNNGSGNNPTGVVDGLVGGTGTVTLSGWAFDRDDISQSLQIHVYIGGSSGSSNAEGHNGIIANEGRADVNAAYGCGDYHGFIATIPTSKTGTQSVYVYALNVGGGENVCIGTGTVNITADTEKPTVETKYLSQITNESYRVCVVPKDNVGIKSVRVATWTQSDQSDIIWHDCLFNGNETYFIDINRSDYAYGATVYQNHIYVYDIAGNFSSDSKEMIYETNPPQISNITISQVSKSGFRISCKISDDTGINSIKFPTWTSSNGQDDIIWYEGTISNGTATCYISSNEHNNELGPYIIHIYLYDTYNNLSTAIINDIELFDEPIEVSSIVYKGKTYKVFNSGYGWEDAKEWCEKNGGHLATINTEEEWEIVKKILCDYNGVKCWLGAESTSGNWKWVTGEDFLFSNWAEKQPDCSGNNEFYLGTWGSESGESLDCYSWNDYAKSGVEVGGFVCEFEHIVGDVNGDGAISIADATEIQQYLASAVDFDDEQLAVADTNGDGSISIADVTEIQQYLAELIPSLG